MLYCGPMGNLRFWGRVGFLAAVPQVSSGKEIAVPLYYGSGIQRLQ